MTICSVWIIFKIIHDDFIKWKLSPRHWPFVRVIRRSPVNSPHKGQWRGAFSFVCAWTNGWLNNLEAGDLRRYRTHYDVIVMSAWRMENVLGFCQWLTHYTLMMVHCLIDIHQFLEIANTLVPVCWPRSISRCTHRLSGPVWSLHVSFKLYHAMMDIHAANGLESLSDRSGPNTFLTDRCTIYVASWKQTSEDHIPIIISIIV